MLDYIIWFIDFFFTHMTSHNLDNIKAKFKIYFIMVVFSHPKNQAPSQSVRVLQMCGAVAREAADRSRPPEAQIVWLASNAPY